MKTVVSSKSSLWHFAITASTLALGALLVPGARADVLFSNFGPGNSYSTSIYIVGKLPPVSQSVAMFFDVPSSANYSFDGFALAANWVSGTDGIRLSLCADSGGLPGAGLESFNLTPAHSSGGILTANSTQHTTLTAGTRYWLAAFGADSTTYAGWNLSSGDTGAFATSEDLGASWFLNSPASTMGVFRIDATVVPEPNSLALLALGGAAALLRRRGR